MAARYPGLCYNADRTKADFLVVWENVPVRSTGT